MPSSSPLDRPSEKAKTVERLMPITCGLRSSMTVLSTCHCSSPQSSACWPRPTAARRPCVERRASNTPPCDVPPSAIRSTHDAARRRAGRGARVEEHVDRAAPRGERLGRGERGEHRVLVVLAHRHDPHVDAVLAHQRRQEGVEALLQPAPAASPPARAACRTAAWTAIAPRRASRR